MVYAGTILEINNNKTYVFTMDYSVVTIKTKNDYFPGKQITFTRRDKYIDLYLLRSNTLKAFALAAAIILIAVAAFSDLLRNNVHRFDEICTALISIDINPSIEISVNRDDLIVEAVAVNEDGVKVLNTLNLKQKPLIDGVNEIVNTSKAMGYIDDNRKVVLVSAALYDSVVEADAPDYASQLKEILSNLEDGSSGTTVLTVFIEDSDIISQAKSNNLSIGKELLYQYAKAQDDSLTADDIRTAGLNELLNKLNALETDGQLVETITNPSQPGSTDTAAVSDPTSTPVPTLTPVPTEVPVTDPVATPAPESTPTPVPEPTTAPKPISTPVPTAVPKVEETPKLTPDLAVSTKEETIRFSWTQLDASTVTYKDKVYKGFQYYKVVASADNPHPVYPEDGYLAVISDRWQNEWSVTPSEGDYNYSPELWSGKTYYFSITYVFDNGKFTSDTETLMIPEYIPEEADEFISSLILTMSSDKETLHLDWTPLSSSSVTYNGKTYNDFNYYKVVASRTNPKPVYPDDGYLTYISDYNIASWSVTPSYGDYNYSPELVAGETYYFSITYVFGNEKLSSNTVQYKVP